MKLENLNFLPFNNEVETGLRILVILNEIYPLEVDLSKLLYLDYITVHSGDLDESKPSLHTSVPYQKGELLIRKPIIQKGLSLLMSKGLANLVYLPTGLYYSASEKSTPFIESLGSNYTASLVDRAKWIASNFANLGSDEMHALLNQIERNNSKFNLEILD